jgi:hypothetical protein
MSDNKAPVEGKVWGATVGTGAGAVVGAFLVWLLGVIITGSPLTSDAESDAVAAVPFRVAAFIFLLVTVGGSFIGGYRAKHTPRPEENSMTWAVPIEGGGVPIEPAKEGESLEEYESRVNDPDDQGYPVPEYPGRVVLTNDKDGDGHDDETGQFVKGS